jgi:single-stranded-DNA-specific exonuclease
MHPIQRLPPNILPRPSSTAVLQRALELGFTPLQARIVSRRLDDRHVDRLDALLRPSLANLDHPSSLPDVEVASNAIADAIVDGRLICLNTDFDCDGTAAGVLCYRILTEQFGVPTDKVVKLQAHRRRDGYGLSETIADQIIDRFPTDSLIVTADQGSSDHKRIARLAEAGYRVVVTDHHAIPDIGPPPEAIACVNPCRVDSQFPDRSICGAAVAWLTLCVVRGELIRRGHLPKDAPRLSGYLDFVAAATIADCSDMAGSVNNRAFVSYGLALMNRPDARPCWQAMRRILKIEGAITAQDLAFGLMPRLNSASRMQHATLGVDWLLADDLETALRCAEVLDGENRDRQLTERALKDSLLPSALAAAEQGSASVVAFAPDGHQGVIGIVASRLLEATGRPSAVFVAKQSDPTVATGSFRSIAGLDVRACIAEVAANDPSIFEGHGFGGHAAAAGAHLAVQRLPDFMLAFEQAVRSRLDPDALAPTALVDEAAPLDAGPMLMSELAVLEPYGRVFDPPTFYCDARVLSITPMGDGTHLRLRLDADGAVIDAVWFRAVSPGAEPPVYPGVRYRFVVQPSNNTYRGRTTLQWQVRTAADRSPIP